MVVSYRRYEVDPNVSLELNKHRISFDIVIPHSILRAMSPADIITDYVFADARLLRVNSDSNMGLCECEIRVEDDILGMYTTYSVRAIS